MTFAALVCMFLLAACAPGTGGTGTGPIQLSSSITFASIRNDSVTNSGQTPTFVAAGCDNTANSLRLETSSIVLTTACGTFTYSGTWSVSEANEAEVVGMWEKAFISSEQPNRSSVAAMKLKFDSAPESSKSVLLRIQDSAGSVLVDFTTLDRRSP